MFGLILWIIGGLIEVLFLLLCVKRVRLMSLTAFAMAVALAEFVSIACFIIWPTLYSEVSFCFDVIVSVCLMFAAFGIAASFALQWSAIIKLFCGLMMVVFVPRIAYLLNQPNASDRVRTFSSICMAVSCAFLMLILMFKPSRYQAGESYKWLAWSLGFLAGGQVVMARFKEAFLFSVTVSRFRQGIWICGIIALIVSCARFKGDDNGKDLRAWSAYAE